MNIMLQRNYFCDMITSMTTPNEEERLLELYHYDLLDTANEESFDDIVQLASRICKVPISAITLIDSHRQWFKARKGIDDPETERELSFRVILPQNYRNSRKNFAVLYLLHGLFGSCDNWLELTRIRSYAFDKDFLIFQKFYFV